MSLDNKSSTGLFKNFKSIDNKYIYRDFHIHSTWTDGKASVQQIIEKACELDLSDIAFTDHIRKESKYFPDYSSEIRRISIEYPINVHIGFEAKVSSLNGEIDVSSEIIKEVYLSIASVHRYPIGKELHEPKSFTKRVCQEIELELSIAALRRGGFSILGHPGGMSILNHKEFPTEFFEIIIVQCKKNNIVFELNSAYHLKQIKELFVLLEKYDPMVSFGSDAHTIDELGTWIGVLNP